MKQPIPPRGKAPAARKEAPAPRHDHGSPQGPTADLKVRYYHRMKPRRVYPLVVQVADKGQPVAAGKGVEPVVVRPVLPGALVTPTEQRLDTNRPGEHVTFYVTPLARGSLADARIDVLQQGRPTQRIGLRMRSTTQLLTWVLLALTILVPYSILYATRYHPLTGMVPHSLTTPDLGQTVDDEKKAAKPGEEDAKAPKPDEEKKTTKPGDDDKKTSKPGDDVKKRAKPDEEKNPDAARGDKNGTVEKKDEKNKDEPGSKEKAETKTDANDRGPKPPAQGPGGGRGRGGPGGGFAPFPGGADGPPGLGAKPPPLPDIGAPDAPRPLISGDFGPHIKQMPGQPGELLEYRLNLVLNNDVPKPEDLPGLDSAGPSIRNAWNQVVPPTTWGLGHAYELLCNMQDFHLAFWSGVLFLLLTLWSCLVHRSRRSSRTAHLQLAVAPVGAHALETLPLGPSDPQVLTVEPA